MGVGSPARPGRSPSRRSPTGSLNGIRNTTVRGWTRGGRRQDALTQHRNDGQTHDDGERAEDGLGKIQPIPL